MLDEDRRRLALALGRAGCVVIALLAPLALLAASPDSSEISAPGPLGPLAGTMIEADRDAPVVLILPGSGPTDRDGNNALGVKATPYRLLAEALAAQGISSVRIDKRGMLGSRAAIADPNAVTIADYAADVRAWIGAIRKRTGASCVWLLGHSEGGLVALKAAQQPAGICGVILVSSPGRRLGVVMREQLRANPANAPLLPPALAAIDSLEAGNRVDPATLPAPLMPLFNPAVQGFLIDLFAQDPAALAGALRVPLLIIQGDRDIQVRMADAEALKAAAPGTTLTVAPGVTHVLKRMEGEGQAANMATYTDPSLPIAAAIPDAIAGFIRTGSKPR